MNPTHSEARALLSLWIGAASVAPPSAAVINAILDHGDICEPRDDGHVLVRLSASRAAQLAASLGAERQRALDVSIVWDEGEQQIVTVLDAGPLRAAPEPQAAPNAYAAARRRGVGRAAAWPASALAA